MTAGAVRGPITAPVSIARACRVGRDVGGAVVHAGKGRRLIEVRNVSPWTTCRGVGGARPALPPADVAPVDQFVDHPA